jgi:hypothetical protein
MIDPCWSVVESVSSLMTAIIQTQICHDYANGTFIYVYCIDQNSRYALGHECSRIPHANTKVVLYEKPGKRPEIVGCLSHIIEHWEDSVKILIIPSILYYSKMYKPQPYQLLIPITCIKLTTLQILYHKLYLSMHSSHHVRKFENISSLHFYYISMIDTECGSSEAPYTSKEPDPNLAVLSLS